MDIFAAFSTDEKLESEGKWFPISKTAKIKVARSGNPNYTAMLREKLKEAQLDMMPGEEGEAVAEAILIEVAAKTLLVDWTGLKDAQGNDVPYSTAQAAKYLGVKDFRAKVRGFADNFEAFRLKAEAEQGNA